MNSNQNILKVNIFYAVLLLSVCVSPLQAQQLFSGQDSTNRTIATAVPFMLIAPDSRASGMGDVGVATTPDPNSAYWNPGKLVFIPNDFGASVSLSPWLRTLINDMYIGYLSGFYKLSDEQVLSLSMRYFDLGELQETYIGPGNEPIEGNLFRPREFSFELAYSRKLTSSLGLGVTLKYINSNLTGGLTTANADINPGRSVAGDVGLYYNKEDLVLFGRNTDVAWGLSVSNFGTKITYTGDDEAQFIPTNLRFGGFVSQEIDRFNKINLALDFNKLLVPSPPIIGRDSLGNTFIASGRDPNRSLLSGIFGSFSDAPNGFTEELNEISISAGAEYWYNDIFAARAGFNYEHPTKGNRTYFTAGLGFRYSVTGIDFSYLVPLERQHPLAETLRLTLFVLLEKQTDADSSIQD